MGSTGILSSENYFDRYAGAVEDGVEPCGGKIPPNLNYQNYFGLEYFSNPEDRPRNTEFWTTILEDEIDNDSPRSEQKFSMDVSKTEEALANADCEDSTSSNSDKIMRRRKQMRMAQRAYRIRKDTMITLLREQVKSLERSCQDMSEVLIKLREVVVDGNKLECHPEVLSLLESLPELQDMENCSTSSMRSENEDNANKEAMRTE